MLGLVPSWLCLATVTVKLMFTEEQAVIPWDKWGGPCKNVSETKCRGGFPGIAAAVREERRTSDHTMMFGSFMQLEQLVTEHPDGYNINEVLWRRAGVSALRLFAPYFGSLAQHERARAAIYLRQSNRLPVVSTNIDVSKTETRGSFEPYYIFDVPNTNIRVGLLSITPSGFWAATNPLRPFMRNLVYLLRQQGVTTIFAYVNSNEISQGDIADLVDFGVDVIVYPTRKGVLSSPGTSFAGGVWRSQFDDILENQIITVSLTYNNATPAAPQLTNCSTGLRTSSFVKYEDRDAAYHADEAYIQKLVDEASAKDPVIGYSTAPMPDGHVKLDNGEKLDSCRHEECHLGTLIADSIRDFRGSDIALVNGGGLRDGWDAGNITRSEVGRALPFKNLLCILNMTAATIYRALEHGSSVVTETGKYNSTAPVTGRFLQVSGLRYSVNPLMPPGQRITRFEVLPPGVRMTNVSKDSEQWQPVDLLRVYRVTTVNYLCSGGDGFDFVPVGNSVIESTEIGMRSVVYNELSKGNYTPFRRDAITYDYRGETLALPKQETNCTEFQQFDMHFETCIDCPVGFWHPGNGSGECTLIPEPAAAFDPLITILPSLLFALVVVVLAGGILRYKKNERLEVILKHAPMCGDVAIVFTDILKSSELWAQYPEAMQQALATHHSVIRELIDESQGYEVKTIGDSFMVAFRSPVRAVEFMLRLQLELLASRWPEDLYEHGACKRQLDDFGMEIFGGLRVRCGCHMGPVRVVRTPQRTIDYEGHDVNAAARVADSGGGGQILITHAVYEAVEVYLNDMVCKTDVEYLGKVKFRGLDESIVVYSIAPEQLSVRRFEPLRGVTWVNDEVDSPSNKSYSHTRASTSRTRDRVLVMQRIRKWAADHGPGGVSPAQFAGLLKAGVTRGAPGMDEGMMLEQVLKYVTLLLDDRHMREEVTEPVVTQRERHSVSVFDLKDNRDTESPAHMKREGALGWADMATILAGLPLEVMMQICTSLDETGTSMRSIDYNAIGGGSSQASRSGSGNPLQVQGNAQESSGELLARYLRDGTPAMPSLCSSHNEGPLDVSDAVDE